MSFLTPNKFGSFRNYLNQVFFSSKANMLLGIVLPLIVVTLLLIIFFSENETAVYGAQILLCFAGSGFLLYWLVPLFHNEYGPKKNQ